MLSGAYPYRHGIIANEWIDPATREAVYNTQDSRCQVIGHKTEPLSGTGPRMLLSETVGDVLRSAQPQSKVIGISGKDRGAILPAGHRGTAYMYMSETGQFASSSYYMLEHPQWVKDFNAAKPADAGTVAAAPGKDGKALIEGSDCRTCHKDDTKLIGPAYQDVAKKYAGQADAVKTLSEKVLKGGSGNWGQIPMAAHPALSEDDAKAMVTYILSMKK